MAASLLELGNLVPYPGVKEVVSVTVAAGLLARHATGDWGDVSEEDWALNNHALQAGSRLASTYDTPRGRVQVITEAERLFTYILLPIELEREVSALLRGTPNAEDKE